MTLDYIIPTESSVIQTIHFNVGLKFFFSILLKCLLFFVCLLLSLCMYDISQRSVETHLWRGGIYNKLIIANCLQCVPVKQF